MKKIDFEFTTQYGVFRDALYLEESHGFSDADIDSLKQERLDRWLGIIENPPEMRPELYQEVDNG